MSSFVPQDIASMPSQLTVLLPTLRAVYIEDFSDLFTLLPQGLSTPFLNSLTSLLTSVRTTLPPVLTSQPPENLALSPRFRNLLKTFTNLLTVALGTVLNIVTHFLPSQGLSNECSHLLTALNIGLYTNHSIDLNALLEFLEGVLTGHGVAQPYCALTNLPSELFSRLNNTPPSHLHLLPIELNDHLTMMVSRMFLDLRILLIDLNDEKPDDIRNNLAAPNYQIERTVQYAYHAREDAETEPDKCSICLEGMKDGDNARRLGCSHTFHLQCIDRWLETKTSCPLCRTPIDATHD